MGLKKRGGKKRIFGGFWRVLGVGGIEELLLIFIPRMGYITPHLTRAYPIDRVEGPAYHTYFLDAGLVLKHKTKLRAKKEN